MQKSDLSDSRRKCRVSRVSVGDIREQWDDKNSHGMSAEPWVWRGANFQDSRARTTHVGLCLFFPERASRSVSVRGERCRQTAEPLQQTRQGTRPLHSTNQQLLENFQLEGSHLTSCPFKKRLRWKIGLQQFPFLFLLESCKHTCLGLMNGPCGSPCLGSRLFSLWTAFLSSLHGYLFHIH